MVSSKIKSGIKFTFSLALAIGLFWYVYKDADLGESINQLKKAKYGWVVLSMLLGAFSYYLRALRWRMLLTPLGYNLSVFNVFNAVMVGYLANLVLPRMGEISRCALLKKTDKVAFTSSLGTVVTERAVDVIMLILVTILTLLVEFENLAEVFQDMWNNQSVVDTSKFPKLLILICSVVISTLVLLWVFRKKLGESALIRKTGQLLKELWLGLMSITKVRSQGLFWISSVAIWIIYYFMSYLVFDAMEPTSDLDWRVGLSVMVMGGIGMAIPVQGGIGSFHALVTRCLVLYGIAEVDGRTFAFLLHSSQLLLVLILGVVSLSLALLISKKGISDSLRESQ